MDLRPETTRELENQLKMVKLFFASLVGKNVRIQLANRPISQLCFVESVEDNHAYLVLAEHKYKINLTDNTLEACFKNSALYKQPIKITNIEV
jgi:hypothetical protein